MRKFLFLSGLIAAGAAWYYFNQKPPQYYADGKPAITLRVVDTTNGQVPIFIEGDKLSLSKNHQLCWATVNIGFAARVYVIEEFFTPAKMTFAATDTEVESSKDGKQHTLTTVLDSAEGKYVSRCWAFDKTDPIGKYKLNVQVDDYEFKDLAFEIVK